MKLLQEKERRIAQHPLKYAVAHEKQQDFFAATQAIRILFWGNRVGKTEGCAQEVARYVLGEKDQVAPPIEIWCACPSYDVQKETTQKKLEAYIPKDQVKHITYIKAGTWGEIELKNGSKINFKSYEQGREKFQGAGKKLIWFDEEPPRDIWEECIVRQEAGQQLDIIMSMTPVKGMTWVYDELFMQTGRDDLYVSEADWDDNPWLTQKQKDLMSANLSDDAIQVRKFGKFIKRVGLVCNWWDREKNLADYPEIPRSYTYFEVLDGGFSDPAAYLLIGVDQDGDIHVVDGFRQKGLSDGELISRRNTIKTDLTITNAWIDYNDTRLSENLAKLGWNLTQVTKKTGDVQQWDEIIAEKLAQYGKMQRGTGKPRLFVNKKLDWLVQEIENLTWLEIKRQTDAGVQIVPKWDDHRRYGHHFDGIRSLGYFVVSYDVDSYNTDPEWEVLQRENQNFLKSRGY